MASLFRKHSKHRTGNRRQKNWHVTKGGAGVCENKDCGKVRPPHTVCPHCGFYGGKLIVPKKTKKSKKQREGGAGGEGQAG